MRNDYDTVKIIESYGAPISPVWLAKRLKINTLEAKNTLKALADRKLIIKIGKLYAIPEVAKEINSKKNSTQKGQKGKIAKTKSGAAANKFNKPQPKVSDIGHVDMASGGFGFFIPGDGSGDIFIPAVKLGSALNGDKVRIKRERFKGRLEAHVVEVLERKQTQIVGRVEVRRRHYLVKPLDRKFTQYIFVRKGNGIYREDDIVVCKIIAFPDAHSEAEGEVIELLGNLADKGIENLIVLNKYNLTREFPEDVANLADSKSQILPNGADDKNRTDFTQLLTVTIDGADARDFDDAISIEKHSGGYTLYVHIADVSFYVERGSVLDNEAYRRGTSVYFPEFAIPMLPESLSTGSCSLNPNVKRYAMTAKISYNKAGERISAEFFKSIIESDARLTYPHVNNFFDGSEAPNTKHIGEMLTHCKELSELINARQYKEGTIDFELSEAIFKFDKDGNIVDIMPEVRGPAERLIEHFMVDTNEVVAEYLHKHAKKSIYRGHKDADMRKIQFWVESAKRFGIPGIKMPDKITPKAVQQLFEKVHDSPAVQLLSSQLVRSMKQAEYTTEYTEHFGLASECYTHFTSPIRRYPDLTVHRLLKEYCMQDNISYSGEQLIDVAQHSSVTERNADSAEREVTQYKKLAYLKRHAGTVMKGYINRVLPTGFTIFIDELVMVGQVDSANMGKGSYYFNVDAGVIHNKSNGESMGLGDYIDVIWVRNDMDMLEAEFAPYYKDGDKGIKGSRRKEKHSNKGDKDKKERRRKRR